jgi:hypothetical protein
MVLLGLYLEYLTKNGRWQVKIGVAADAMELTLCEFIYPAKPFLE